MGVEGGATDCTELAHGLDLLLLRLLTKCDAPVIRPRRLEEGARVAPQHCGPHVRQAVLPGRVGRWVLSAAGGVRLREAED